MRLVVGRAGLEIVPETAQEQARSVGGIQRFDALCFILWSLIAVLALA